jgi:hypothetical protein
MQVQPSQLMRICAFSRPLEDMPKGLRDVSNWKGSRADSGGVTLVMLRHQGYAIARLHFNDREKKGLLYVPAWPDTM